MPKSDKKLVIKIITGHRNIRDITFEWGGKYIDYSRLFKDEEETETAQSFLVNIRVSVILGLDEAKLLTPLINHKSVLVHRLTDFQTIIPFSFPRFASSVFERLYRWYLGTSVNNGFRWRYGWYGGYAIANLVSFNAQGKNLNNKKKQTNKYRNHKTEFWMWVITLWHNLTLYVTKFIDEDGNSLPSW